MSTTCAWEDVLAQVKTDLAGINGTGSYTYIVDAANIHRDVIDKEAVVTPGIIMLPGRLSPERQASNKRRFFFLQITIAGVLRLDDTDQSKDKQLNTFGGDILLAMTSSANYLHSNKVLNTFFDGMETVFLPEERLGLVLCDFRLKLHNTWEAP